VTECLNMFSRSEKVEGLGNAMKPDQRGVDEHPLESVKGRAMRFTKEARGRNGMYHVAEEDRIRLDGREDT